MRIWIDEGHGGAQPGACAQGYKEKDLTLKIGNALAAELARCGITVSRTRTSDVDIPLDTRGPLANKWGADLFVSVHLNSGGGHGAETWCSITGGASKALAACIQAELVGLGYTDRGVKSRKGSDGRDYLAVIRETNMPAVLAEVGFIDNSGDMRIFNAAKAAQAIARGICAYAGIAYTAVATKPTFTAPAITGLSLDTHSKDMRPGEVYEVLARCVKQPTVHITGLDVIKLERVTADPRGWKIRIKAIKKGFAHITVVSSGLTAQCNFNVR